MMILPPLMLLFSRLHSGLDLSVAGKFLDLTKNSKKPLTVYMINNRTDNSNFFSYCYYRKIVDPTTPVYHYLMPIDWQRPSTFRLSEDLMSDYLIFRPVIKSLQKVRPSASIKTLNMEEAVFESLLSNLYSSSGLKTVTDRKDCLLSKITNLEAFKRSLRVMVKSNI